MKLYICVVFCCLTSIKPEKIFLPNANYGNKNNWKENQVPCSGNHIVFPKKTPKIFLDGVFKMYQISEMNLPMNGELVLDDKVTITTARFDNEAHACDTIESHFNKLEPDYWYNPNNWCVARSIDSPCLKTIQIEASIVPSANDFVIFPQNNTFYVGISSSEPRILANKVYYRGKVYTHSILFRQKIRRSFTNKILEFENVSSLFPPQIDLLGNRCNPNLCGKNSNLEKMSTICKYVSCPSVTCKPVHQIRPLGSCCIICGHIVKVQFQSSKDKTKFDKWFANLVDTELSKVIRSDLLSVNLTEFQLTVAKVSDEVDNLDEIVSKLLASIILKKQENSVLSVQCVSCQKVEKTDQRYGYEIIILIFAATSALVLLTVFICWIKNYRTEWISYFFRSLPSLPKFQMPTVNFNFFHSTFPRSRLEEHDDETQVSAAISSIFPSGIEAIELPDTGIEVAFDNPIYSPDVNDSRQ